MKIGAGLILFRSTAWKPMENVIATMIERSQNFGKPKNAFTNI